MKIVAVTGCMGLIGSHVTSELLQRGYLVLGIDKLTYAANSEAMQTFNGLPGFTFLP